MSCLVMVTIIEKYRLPVGEQIIMVSRGFVEMCKANPADVENAAADNAWLKSAGWGEM